VPDSSAGVFYRIDSRRVSIREYWWGTKSPLILVALLLKALRLRIPSSTDDPNVEALAPFEVDGAPAFVAWLHGKGCGDFRYGWSAGGGSGEDEEL
jgi:hypothetical protein